MKTDPVRRTHLKTALGGVTLAAAPGLCSAKDKNSGSCSTVIRQFAGSR